MATDSSIWMKMEIKEMTTDELTEKMKKLEIQVNWMIDHNVGSVSYERVEKLEIQVNCLRKQVLDLEGKKSYTRDIEETIPEPVVQNPSSNASWRNRTTPQPNKG